MIAGIILIPTADVRPVVRGQWEITSDPRFRCCSVCHDNVVFNMKKLPNFCDVCGADMRDSQLRECGLCGNEHVRLEQSPNGFWHVVCDRYACDRKVDHYYDNPDEAVYQWNTKNYILI